MYVNWGTEEMIMIEKIIDNMQARVAMDHKVFNFSFGDPAAQKELKRR